MAQTQERESGDYFAVLRQMFQGITKVKTINCSSLEEPEPVMCHGILF